MPLIEYLRPWKLVTLAIGIAILIVGARIEQLPDWDTGISVVMGLLTYLTAPWGVRVCIERRWRWVPLALVYAWISIDLSYWAWNAHLGSDMVDIYRQANMWPSTCLYFLCGFIWLYRGSLADLATNLRNLRRSRPENL
ncbi:hypothetical protein QTI66_37620 [Variovorax sp. J22R133]|uniref:hypothetical protein n=1 Tax=Variovorax brevis TaxID=3053503 RepID=UPI002578FCEF|nr:hypothetical protein [Variovorax sp. J22R133]MDM0117818.1 hypothetical protein [Variovorax sp. J22R133]